jgi:hypothetical protein
VGLRAKPPWGIAELDYKGWGSMGTYIDTAYMIVRAEAKTEAAILRAMRGGRFYSVEPAITGALKLDDWSISVSGKAAGSGDTLEGAGLPRFHLALSRLGKPNVGAMVQVIRNGQVILGVHSKLPAQWDLEDTVPAGSCSAYRVIVRDDENGELASNPIFVRLAQPKDLAKSAQ